MEKHTLLLGSHIIWLPVADSTNDHAKYLLKQQPVPPYGTVVVAEWQTHGRGQRQNIWHAEKGKNITLSLIVYPNFLKTTEQFLLSQIVSVGIADFLNNLIHLPVSIKWPNDILIHNKKVSGLLIENIVNKEWLKESIIGIGLNVNQTEFPETLINKAISLKQISGVEYHLPTLILDLLSSIEKYYLKAMHGQQRIIKESYLQRLFQYQIISDYRIRGQHVAATIEGISQEGLLLMRVKDQIIALCQHEVEYLL